MESGLICWNHRLSFGIPTYSSQARRENTGFAYTSIIDLFLSYNDLVNPQLQVREDLSMGSDHHPVTLSCVLPTSPPPSTTHPRLVWNLSRMLEPDCLYGKFISERRATILNQTLMNWLRPLLTSYTPVLMILLAVVLPRVLTMHGSGHQIYNLNLTIASAVDYIGNVLLV
ncbi:hypothetical protein G6F29_013841 [Rhizopus arrhizus]|nr:hypothetical protein G6F29_013841 [Rhizopus arrhizus]KAG0972896.1 hypothetical protein G6F28_013805 [Rhizopus arrhizus]KAG0999918.1 hypothetical protein G6F27_013789 [Rhizopus arrhizus]KAG1007658.1 hypothetical protein G6F26_013788 [Rhizopus arrhizus]KAG1017640.1 hypothetical protein G6F25_013879 [Rhizopus arrhizus]